MIMQRSLVNLNTGEIILVRAQPGRLSLPNGTFVHAAGADWTDGMFALVPLIENAPPAGHRTIGGNASFENGVVTLTPVTELIPQAEMDIADSKLAIEEILRDLPALLEVLVDEVPNFKQANQPVIDAFTARMARVKAAL